MNQEINPQIIKTNKKIIGEKYSANYCYIVASNSIYTKFMNLPEIIIDYIYDYNNINQFRNLKDFEKYNFNKFFTNIYMNVLYYNILYDIEQYTPTL